MSAAPIEPTAPVPRGTPPMQPLPAALPPHLRHAQHLLHYGLKLVRLLPFTKQPEGKDWNHPTNYAKEIDPNATGYGLPLAANNLCSIDPDNVEYARVGLEACGFDLDEIMRAGVRTISTRRGSGGRSTFSVDDRLCWVRFTAPGIGTVLELRADSPNLQDAVPGVLYRDKEGNDCTQDYATSRRFDDVPELPDAFCEWWARCSTDKAFLHDQQALFFAAIEKAFGVAGRPALSLSTGKHGTGSDLPFDAPGVRGPFNRAVRVEEILAHHGYLHDERSGRWSPPSATGAPGVRPIPNKDGLWRSDHGSDPLCGTFDAWIAFVVLEHDGDVESAIEAARAMPFMQVTNSSQATNVVPLASTGSASSAPPVRQRYELLRASELAALPPVAWAVRNVLPRSGVAAMYGAPGSGKTFLALDLAAALAEGLELWFGRPVRRAPIVYVALEGGAGLAARCKARELHTGRPLPDDLYFVVRQDFSFDRPVDVEDLLRAVREKLAESTDPPVIVVDTLARAAVGLEENSATDMGKVVDAAYRLANETGGLVLLIHHPGKNSDGGLRGSSTLLGAMDAVVRVEVTPSGPRWTLEKSKDGPLGEEGSFQLLQVEVGEDDQGDPVTSAVVVQSAVPTKASSELPPAQRLARSALVETAKRLGTFGSDGDSVWVQVELWREAFYEMQADSNDDARRKAFSRARKGLREAGYTQEFGEAVRLNEAMDVLQAAEAIRQRDSGT
jgi:KaiC/GvpD/RAD55 family RecA-like ATPase